MSMESETCIRCGTEAAFKREGDFGPPNWGTVQLEVVGRVEWGYVCEKCFESIRVTCRGPASPSGRLPFFWN